MPPRRVRQHRRPADERDDQRGHVPERRRPVEQRERRDPDEDHAGSQEHEVPVDESREPRQRPGQRQHNRNRESESTCRIGRGRRRQEDVDACCHRLLASGVAAQAQAAPRCGDARADRERCGCAPRAGHADRIADEAHEQAGEKQHRDREQADVLVHHRSAEQAADDGEHHEQRGEHEQVTEEGRRGASSEAGGHQVRFERTACLHRRQHRVHHRQQQRCACGRDEEAALGALVPGLTGRRYLCGQGTATPQCGRSRRARRSE